MPEFLVNESFSNIENITIGSGDSLTLTGAQVEELGEDVAYGGSGDLNLEIGTDDVDISEAGSGDTLQDVLNEVDFDENEVTLTMTAGQFEAVGSGNWTDAENAEVVIGSGEVTFASGDDGFSEDFALNTSSDGSILIDTEVGSTSEVVQFDSGNDVTIDTDNFQSFSFNGLDVEISGDDNTLSFIEEGSSGGTSENFKTDAYFLNKETGDTEWSVSGDSFDGDFDFGDEFSFDEDLGWTSDGDLNIWEAMFFESGDSQYAVLSLGSGNDGTFGEGSEFGIVDVDTGEHWTGSGDNFEMGSFNSGADTIDGFIDGQEDIELIGVGYWATQYVEGEATT